MQKSAEQFALAVVYASLGVVALAGPVESPAPESVYASPEFLAVARDGQSVFATCATGQRIARVGLDGSKRGGWTLESRSAGGVRVNPTGIAAAKGFVYVTCGVQTGELQKFREDGAFVGAASVGHSPCAPVVSPDGSTVYVMNRFSAKVSEVDAATMKVRAEMKVLREPFAAGLGAGGKLLFVANMLPYCAATNDVVAASVSVIDTATRAVRHVMLPNGSTGVRGLGVSPDGASVYVTHTMGRYQLPTTQLERGWMNTAALSIFDGATGAYVNTVLLDDVDRGGGREGRERERHREERRGRAERPRVPRLDPPPRAGWRRRPARHRRSRAHRRHGPLLRRRRLDVRARRRHGRRQGVAGGA